MNNLINTISNENKTRIQAELERRQSGRVTTALMINRLCAPLRLKYCGKLGRLMHFDQFYTTSSGSMQGYSIPGYVIWGMEQAGKVVEWNKVREAMNKGAGDIGLAAIVTNNLRDELNGRTVLKTDWSLYLKARGFDTLSTAYKLKGSSFRTKDTATYAAVTELIEKVDPIGLLLHGCPKHGIHAQTVMAKLDEELPEHEYTYSIFGNLINMDVDSSVRLTRSQAITITNHVKARENLFIS